MTQEDLTQHATLFRKSGGMATAPDEPIWVSAGKVAEGPLGDVLEKWKNLPPSHQPSHAILIGDRTLGEREIRAMLGSE
ncbi:hypothetical protein [Sphingopyxis sp. GC21]|uniref:hypothetical protein n=1 Tax=Sphingopyxis sp. GC21 TaxID=2933562 RepID=UPI0021E3E97A|nr:hypothetical protein [Sphingopyxis sp. GC21]